MILMSLSPNPDTDVLTTPDMIRERDRALHEKDRLSGANKDEVEKLKRELRLAQDKADNMSINVRQLSATMAEYDRDLSMLETQVREKKRLEESLREKEARLRDSEARLREKDEELEVYKAGMDQTLVELNDLRNGDTVINDIVDSVLQAGIQRVDDAMFELDSQGNQNAPTYVLSLIEKASSTAMEFATSFNNFIADSDATEVVKSVGIFAGAIADVCGNTKGLRRLATDPKGDALVGAARQSALSTIKFFRALISVRLDGMDPIQKTDVVINCNNDVQIDLQKLNKLVEGFAPKLPGRDLDEEMTRAAAAIEAAANRLAKLRSKPTTYELQVHESILDAATAITQAIAQLIRAATATQQEIVAAGRGSSTRAAFYKKNNRWTEGLISAAKAVATSTNTLIETADGVLSSRNTPEQLIVASNDVSASTAQLVAASRVKAGNSRNQEGVETASKAVGAACRALVRQVRGISEATEEVDYSKMGGHEFKVKEMEQQVSLWRACGEPFCFLSACPPPLPLLS